MHSDYNSENSFEPLAAHGGAGIKGPSGERPREGCVEVCDEVRSLRERGAIGGADSLELGIQDPSHLEALHNAVWPAPLH